jgi:hypothetical protein
MAKNQQPNPRSGPGREPSRFEQFGYGSDGEIAARGGRGLYGQDNPGNNPATFDAITGRTESGTAGVNRAPITDRLQSRHRQGGLNK